VASNTQLAIEPIWNCSPDRIRTLDALHTQERERIARDGGGDSATGASAGDPALISNGMRRTRWEETYKGLDWQLLWGLTVPPRSTGQAFIIDHDGETGVVSSAEDEQKLLIIGRAVNRFLSRCEQTARHTDHSIRCWLRSQIPGRPYKAASELLTAMWKVDTCSVFRIATQPKEMAELGYAATSARPVLNPVCCLRNEVPRASKPHRRKLQVLNDMLLNAQPDQSL
jgi:hypothetical protein